MKDYERRFKVVRARVTLQEYELWQALCDDIGLICSHSLRLLIWREAVRRGLVAEENIPPGYSLDW